ncbi:MAG: YcaO-like family protein [Desulfobacteraceae bacterium]|nr:YcaO-like family protein [Desulfobacteraceae bacterium]
MSTDPSDFQQYHLTRIKTEAATGYFDCTPAENLDFDQALAISRRRPNDEFIRKHLLRLIASWPAETLKARIRGIADDDLFLKALFFEACLLVEPFAPLRAQFDEKELARLAQTSPFIYIKAHRLKDHRLHRRWIDRLRPNFSDHAPLPHPKEIDLPAPVEEDAMAKAMLVAQPLERLAGAGETKPWVGTAADRTATTALALERLNKAGVPVGAEMRHEASLSPIALQRTWQLSLKVDCGRHHYGLTGEQISYGRGLELEAARVACVMEIVERVSSYASVDESRVQGYQNPYPLTLAKLSELTPKGIAALDPNRLGLEAPYRDEPLHWIEGQIVTAGGPGPILVPAQCVFLFCNLDEVKLFSGLGSNGLGAGGDLAQAKVKALLEVIERDSAATIPFTPELCFDVETKDVRVARLLQSYAELGIRVGFVDLTGPLGVPCCKAYVKDGDGHIAAGTGAHLNARQALISALTETPYPYPHADPSQFLARPAVRVPLEALPDYDQGGPEANLRLLEQLLLTNGYEPIYIDLTRQDLALPVARAIVPGMELLGDFDRFSRVHPRLYGHYLKYARK